MCSWEILEHEAAAEGAPHQCGAQSYGISGLRSSGARATDVADATTTRGVLKGGK